MSLDTDFNTSPYFDDFAESKNFHRMLFVPAVPIQARELTQLQTILQNQIERFGKHIFKDGTILTGCNFTFDPNYNYIKLPDLLINGQPTNVAGYANTYIRNSSNLTSLVFNTYSGFEAQNPDLNTLYIKYLNTGTGGEKEYVADETLTIYGRHANGDINTANTVAQVKVANTTYANAVGIGFGFSVADGYIFQKGHFIRVDAQTIVVDKYNKVPHELVIGFETAESIVDENVDTSLLDNAQGFSNENAPGAHRLKLTPTLAVYPVGGAPNTFFSLVEFDYGRPIKQKETTEYNNIGREMSKRTFEESGNYVVRPFSVTSAAIASNTTHLNLNVGSGLAYIDGFRVEQYDTASLPIEKGTDVREKTAQVVSTNFGNYILVNEVLGAFQFNYGATVSLRDTAAQKLTNENYTVTAPGTQIGTAKMRSIVYESGAPGAPDAVYRLYLFDIEMSAGANFSSVRSVYYDSTFDGVADVVLESGSAYLYETDFNRLIFPFGQKAIKTLRDLSANNDTSFTYRTYKDDGAFNTGGSLSITLPAGFTHPYTAGSTLNDTQERDVVVVATVTSNSANLTGTVAYTNGANGVTGTGTSFLSNFSVGQYIAITNGAQTKRISSITNNTHLQVSTNFASSNTGSNFARAYPANVPIKTSGTGGGSISIDGSGQTMTISLGTSITNTMNVVVYHDVLKATAVQINKDVNKNIYTKINCSNNAANSVGPWCLGVPDAFDIVAVYKSTNFTGIEDPANDVTDHFSLDVGQTDNHYGLSYLRQKTSSSITLTGSDRLLVVFNTFKQNATGGGRGFFSVDSYPIDDSTLPTPNTAIRTEQIPVYNSENGSAYDLRNCIDFRPQVANTGAYAASAGAATTNPSATETFSAAEKHFPSPNSNLSADLQYYLGRIDRIVLDSFGSLRAMQGVASENPVPPASVNNTMPLALVNVPAYPSLSIPEAITASRPDYAVKFKLTQNKRYTMEDIGNLEQRLSRVEYYTALTLLEKETKDLIIPSSVDPTLDRFKNGILVDPFTDFNISNLTSPEYKAGVDFASAELIPQFNQNKFDLVANTLSNVIKSGDVIMLSYGDSPLFRQPYATKYRNLTEQFYKFKGKLIVSPSYDNYFETQTTPQTVSIDNTSQSLDLVDNLNRLLPLNSQSSTVINERDNLIANNAYSQTFEHVRDTVVTTTSQQIRSQTVENNVQVGDFVTDIRFLPYIRAQRIHVYGYGLRPSTEMNVFFNKENVSAYCLAATATASNGSVDFSTYRIKAAGTALMTDETGNFFAVFDVPANTFLVGERELLVIDVDSASSFTSSTTLASTLFNAYNFSVERTNLTLSTRRTEIDIATVTSSTTTTERTTNTRPTSPPVGPLTPAPSTGTITMWSEPNFTGFSTSFSTQQLNMSGYFANGYGWNDTISSIQVSGGEWDVFVDRNFGGASMRISSNTANLGGFNNRISSFKPVQTVVETTSLTYGPFDTQDVWWAFQNNFCAIDPLAQTFIIDPQMCGGDEGLFISKMDLFFKSKHNTLGVTLEIRTTQNGFPTKNIVPFSKRHLNSSDVVISDTAAQATTFTFETPVFLKAGYEYAFVVIPDADNPDYKLFCSEIGETDLLTPDVSVTQDWGAGMMFMSHNNSTWTPLQNEDIKFNMYRALFTQTSGYCTLTNKSYEYLTISNTNGTFQIGEPIVQLAASNANGTVSYTSGNNIVVGTGTDFLSRFAVGSYITIRSGANLDVQKVTAVSNNTYLTVKDDIRLGTNTAATHQLAPVGTVFYIDSVAGEMILVDSNAANSTFLFSANSTLIGGVSQANSHLETVDNKIISYFQPLIYRTSVQGTSLSLKAITTANSGTQSSLKSYSFNKTNYLDTNEVVIMSRSNEITNLAGAKSFDVRIDFSSITSLTSPTVDMQAASILYYENLINNDSTAENTPSGNALCKYISKTVNLAEGQESEDMRVLLTAYRPALTDIEVYVRLQNEFDSEAFSDKHWTKLELKNNLLSDGANRDDYVELEYNVPTLPDKTQITGFVATTNASANVNGTGTDFVSDLAAGDTVFIDNGTAFFVTTVSSVTNTTQVVLSSTVPFTNTTTTIYTMDNPQSGFRDTQNDGIVSYINAGGAKFSGFKTFAVKVVMLADGTNLVPRLKDLRALAITV